MNNHLTLHDALTASGRYLDRATHPDLTTEIIENLTVTNDRINAFLDDIGYTGKRDCTSGFRPSSVNEELVNSAKKSGHLVGLCEDLADDKLQTLAKLVCANPVKLKKHGLMIEDPDYTRGKNGNWVHLDRIGRSARSSQMFIPYSFKKTVDGDGIMIAQELPPDDNKG